MSALAAGQALQRSLGINLDTIDTLRSAWRVVSPSSGTSTTWSPAESSDGSGAVLLSVLSAMAFGSCSIGRVGPCWRPGLEA